MTDDDKQSQVMTRALAQPIRSADRVPRMLVAAADQLEAIAVEGFDLRRLAAHAVMAINKTPALTKASGASILLACLEAARCGIEPDGTHGAIVPFKGQAQFLPMFRGIIAVATSSGVITKAYAEAVHENDDLSRWTEDGEQHLRHVPPPLGKPRGPMVGAYAVVTLASGERKIDVMDLDELHKRRDVSASWKFSGERSVWGQWPEEMAKKTVLKRCLKTIGTASSRLHDVIAMDTAHDIGAKWAGSASNVDAPRLEGPPVRKQLDAAPKDRLAQLHDAEDELEEIVNGPTVDWDAVDTEARARDGELTLTGGSPAITAEVER